MNELYLFAPGLEPDVPQRWKVGAGETLTACFIVLPGVSADLTLNVDVVGEGASVLLAGAWVCGGQEHVSVTVQLHHHSGRSTSRQLFNGIAGGSSSTEFYGRIVIVPDAQQVEAYQENHNILLSETATVRTRPQLEIYADDVKCSHGATTGRLSAEEQFYMRQRGIPEEEAKVLQMISFLSPVLEAVDEAAREDIASALEAAVRQIAAQ